MSEKEKLLLHFCCGPCGPYIYEELCKNYQVTAFWYNPNIFPAEEYNRRLEAFTAFCSAKGMEPVIASRMDLDAFDSYSDSLIRKGFDKCVFCYEERIECLVKYANSLGIRNFSTTLLASFYQKLDVVNGICLRFARDYSLNFVSGEYHGHYYDSKNKARDMGLYLQKYCGCRHSMAERGLNTAPRPKRP